MALKINFKDFKAQFPFRFKAKTTREEANKLLSGIEANMDILPDFEVEEGTEINSAFFKQLERDINADQVRQDEAFQLAIENIEVPVTSVNEKTGAVSLTASDVGAVPTTRKVNNKALSADITLDKSDVGLGSVENYGIASTAQAQAGTANNLYMTPALVKAAVERLGLTMRVFTANGTFVVPDGVNGIYVTACGGGGGGGGGSSAGTGYSGGGGGGGTCIIRQLFKVTPKQSINIVVGAGGGGGSGNGASGVAGGITTLSGLISLPGGGGGGGDSNNGASGVAGGSGGGNGAGRGTNSKAQDGIGGNCGSGIHGGKPVQGGASHGGAGTDGTSVSAGFGGLGGGGGSGGGSKEAGHPGGGSYGGGGGGGDMGTLARTGAGGPGIVIIEW